MVKRARIQLALRLPYEQVAELRAIRERTGRGVTEQIEMAISDYLTAEGKKTAARRAQTRRAASTRQQR